MASNRVLAAELILDRFDNPEKFIGESWSSVHEQIKKLGHSFWDIASQMCSEREIEIILSSMLKEPQ